MGFAATVQRSVLVFVLMSTTLAVAGRNSANNTTVYADIDQLTTFDAGGSSYGWGWCGDPGCAGGNSTATQRMHGGDSRQFVVSGNAWADGLWWYKLGPNSRATSFQFEFWLSVSPETPTYSHALEFDVFQFISPTRYMFGTQCNYSNGYNHGTWDVWDEQAVRWYGTKLRCPAFVPGHWYHVTWTFNRTPDGNEHYNSVTVRHYDRTGTRELDQSVTPVNLTLPSGRLPRGWNNTMGVQFQLDINGAPGTSGRATYNTIVHRVSLTAW